MNVTNQQLAFARVQVQAARKADSPLVRRAHWQAAVFQLNSALEAYALELQRGAKLAFPLEKGRLLFTRMLSEFEAAGTGSAELGELVHLEQDAGSWLARTHQWAENLQDLGGDQNRQSLLAETSLTRSQQEETVKDAEAGRADRIELVDADAEPAGPAPFNEMLLQEALELAAELVGRQRESSSEW